jgi:RHS repeat-associated protein
LKRICNRKIHSSAAFYQQDGLGSVTALSGSAGSLLNSYAYDAFGNLQTSEGSFTNPFLYTGRDLDVETGLRYYRARYYDSQIGRFLNEDPSEFGAGPNFYRYVNNNPVSLYDPTGLCADDGTDACHAQLSARLGLGGKMVGVPHLWWWISIGTQDYIISGTGTKWDMINGLVLNAYVTPGTQSESNPEDKVGNGTVVFDTRTPHGGFASPEDCTNVTRMLDRALHYPNYIFPYNPGNPFDPMTSNTVAYYVGWPYIPQITPPNRAWGWGTFLPGLEYPDYH